jgi:hypothetical protein
VALAVAGKAAEWALRQAARRLAGSAGVTARHLLARSPAGRVVAKAIEPQVVAPAAEALLTEVIVMWRMVRRPENGSTVPTPRR